MNTLFSRVATQIRQGAVILSERGFKGFLQNGLYFLGSHLLDYQTFYVYRLKLGENNNRQCPPAFIEHKLVDKTSDYSDLVSKGYDFSTFVVKNDNRLLQGAMCLCYFQNKTISHIIWIALDQQAKESLIDLPCQVDFESGEAYLGRMARNPKLPRMTFSAIAIYFQALEVLFTSGKKSCTFIVRQNNLLPQIGLAKRADIRPRSSARYFRLLWRQWWWEKPIGHLSKVFQRDTGEKH